METLESRLIPYASQEELSKIVKNLLNYNFKNFEPDIIRRFVSSKGLLVRYPYSAKAMSYDGYYTEDELTELLRKLPGDHEINKEILKQSSLILQNILKKNKSEMIEMSNGEKNIFNILDRCSSNNLFQDLSNAAYHILKEKPLCDISLREAEVINYATRAMISYINKKTLEVKDYLHSLYKEKVEQAYVISGYMKLRDSISIEYYFEFFREMNGENEIILDGKKKTIDFKFIGRKLKRNFPDYNFEENIEKLDDENLKVKVRKIFDLINTNL